MIRSAIINKYLSTEFLKVIINMTLFFFCLGFVMALFEEINFFKDYDVNINVPIILTLLFVPGVLYKMFPLIIYYLEFGFF